MWTTRKNRKNIKTTDNRSRNMKGLGRPSRVEIVASLELKVEMVRFYDNI